MGSNQEDNKDCFVICPIGSEGSETRERANKLMDHIIRDPVEEFGYSLLRADQIAATGSITNQIIERVVESELVIADLTNHNPNVFYELAVRHASAKPYIQVIDSSSDIPFDISDIRTIKYDFDVKVAERARNDLRGYLENMVDNDMDFDNPISQTADFKSWRESGDPVEQHLVEIHNRMNAINKKIDQLHNDMGGNVSNSNPNRSEGRETEKSEVFTGNTDSRRMHEVKKRTNDDNRKTAEDKQKTLDGENH